MIRKLTCLLFGAALSIGLALGAVASGAGALHYEVKLKSASFGDMGTRELWVKGDNMCWNSKSVNLEVRLVKNKQGVFLIHPWNKVAAKYPEESNRGNVRALLPGPAGSVKAFLTAAKAEKKGRETVNKELCDVYSYSDALTKSNCKLWVSAKSGKPVQLVVAGDKGKRDTITATYTRYEADARVPDSIFEVPKGYAIRPMPERKAVTGEKPDRKSSNKSG